MDSEITLITCLFDIGRSKWVSDRKIDDYLEKGERVCKLKQPMVIFTQVELELKIREMRSHLDPSFTRIVIKNFEDMKYFDQYDQIEKTMKQNLFLRPLKHRFFPQYVQPEYFILIHNKIYLMKEVVDENYFNSKYFQWIDFGAHPDMCPKLEEFKVKLYLNGKLRLMGFDKPQKIKNLIEFYSCLNDFRPYTAATVFGGDREVITKLTPLCDQQVKFMIKYNLTDTEQKLFYYLVCNFPELFDYHVWSSWDNIVDAYLMI